MTHTWLNVGAIVPEHGRYVVRCHACSWRPSYADRHRAAWHLYQHTVDHHLPGPDDIETYVVSPEIDVRGGRRHEVWLEMSLKARTSSVSTDTASDDEWAHAIDQLIADVTQHPKGP